jgi:hypothetical protein
MLITVTDFFVKDDGLADGDYTLRFTVAGGEFVDSDGVQRPDGSTQDFPATVSGGVLTAEPFPLAVTTDATVNQRSFYRVTLHKGRTQINLAQNIVVPWTDQAGYTWAELKLFEGAQLPYRDSAVYNKTETIREIDLRIGALGFPDATTTVKGKVKLDTAPAADPVAVGTNSRLLVSGVINATRMFGMVGDDSTDNTAALLNLRAYLLAAGNRGVKVFFEEGAYRHKQPFWAMHVKNLHLYGPGAKFRNTNSWLYGKGYGFAAGGNILGSVVVNTNPATIETTGTHAFTYPLSSDYKKIFTVEPGSDTITLKDSSAASLFPVGMDIIIAGYDVQGPASFPPNVRFFQYARVAGVAGAVLTLDRPTQFRFDENWPELGVSFGAAFILPLNKTPLATTFAESLIVEDLEFLPNPNAGFAETKANSSTYFNVTSVRNFVGRRLRFVTGAFGNGESFTWEDCDITGDLEGDKMLTTARHKNCYVWRMRSYTGVRNVVTEDCRLFALQFFEPHASVFERCTLSPGLTSTGAFPLPQSHSVNSMTLSDCAFVYAQGSSRWMFATVDRPALTVQDVVSPTQIRVRNDIAPFPAVSLAPGVVMYTDSGKRAVVKNILQDGASITTVLVDIEAWDAPVAGDIYKYYRLQNLISRNSYWVNLDDRVGQQRNYNTLDLPAARYTNDRENNDSRVVVIRDLPYDLPFGYNIVGLNGYLERLEVNITKAYAGANTGLMNFGSAVPGVTINTKQLGYRILTRDGAAGNQVGDVFPGTSPLQTPPYLNTLSLGGGFSAGDTDAQKARGHVKLFITDRV